MENTTKIHFHHDNVGDNLDGTNGRHILFSTTKDRSTDSSIKDTTPSKPNSRPLMLTYLMLPHLTSMIRTAGITMNHDLTARTTIK